MATTLVLASSTLIGVAVASASRTTRLEPTQVVVESKRLVEQPHCWGADPKNPDALPAVDGAMVQAVTVTIEPTSLLKLDRRGKVSAAATNTGCRPHATDHLYVVNPDGSLREAKGIDVDRVKWTGDFREWGFVPQRTSGGSDDDHESSSED
ncbi:MAG: hypothetical protein ACOYMR_12350 [Ilumatobacteraceae bacterium]